VLGEQAPLGKLAAAPSVVLAVPRFDVPLSVLDLAPVGAGSSPGAALASTVKLARHTERLGFHRFWVAEHHNMPGIASSAPAVLLAHLATATRSIRIGSGGVMLPNHPPLVVAEQFGMLEALHPGRVDLGIGRAPGTDAVTAQALRRTANPLSVEEFPEQLTELMGYFGLPGGQERHSVTAVPGLGDPPDVWLLGSSGYSAQVAGLLGLPFAFAHHFSATNTLPALALYRQRFRPSARLAEPYALVCASVLAAEDDERARYLAGPGALSFLRLRQNQPGQVPTPEEAASYPYTELEQGFVADRLSSQIIGGPDTVLKGITDLLEQTQANELMVTTLVHDPADRLRSYELVAELAELSPAPELSESGPSETGPSDNEAA
jgi:luciferase family oxidoreductase group 1